MAIFSKLRPIPSYRKSPNGSPPNYKGLCVGINYGSRRGALKGAVDDAKDFKTLLQGVYRYPDVVLMTDEDENKGTDRWPSMENILQAIDNLVRGASSGDNIVFYYAGHCGQVDDGEQQCIIACDDEDILGETLRQRLINPLPMGSRLIVIVDACHSGALLSLGDYVCHCTQRKRTQSFSSSLRPKKRIELPRRKSLGGEMLRVQPNTSFLSLPRRRFKKAITTTLAVIRFQSNLEKKSKGDENDAAPPTPTGPTQFCTHCHRAFDFSKAPVVIFLSACKKDQQTWEDTKRRGKGMTTKLLKILRKEPLIKLGELERQLKCLCKLSFKRVKKAIAAFRHFSMSEKVLPEQKENLKNKYQARGVFDYRDQSAQVASLRPVGPNERFLYERTEDVPD